MQSPVHVESRVDLAADPRVLFARDLEPFLCAARPLRHEAGKPDDDLALALVTGKRDHRHNGQPGNPVALTLGDHVGEIVRETAQSNVVMR